MARNSWLNKRVKIRPRFLLLLAIPVLLLCIAIFRANARIGELEEQVEKAQKQVLDAYAQTEELERRIAFMDTDEYIEQEARERYNLLGEGEIRFVLGSENSENTEEMLEGKPYATAIPEEETDLPAEQPVPTPMPGGGA